MINDIHGRLYFGGCEEAELFTEEISQSLQGAFKHLYIGDQNDPNYGFVHASAKGYPWHGAMWTRDAGVFLRELAEFGYLTEACAITEYLVAHSAPNPEGYVTFAEHMGAGERKYGTELDGTSAIIIGMYGLLTKLPAADPFAIKVKDFLLSPHSPIEYMLKILATEPLIPGSGEFGGGCTIKGIYLNVVQNNLARLVLLGAIKIHAASGNAGKAAECESAARKLAAEMSKYLVDDKGRLIWCVDPDTRQPDPAIINHEINKGAGLINGVLSMTADVTGFELDDRNFPLLKSCRETFDNLFDFPLRRELFEKYGVWIQFDDYRPGSSGASYGQAYAIQCMLLLSLSGMAEKALYYLTHETYAPIPEYKIERESPYHFYERYYCPYSVECGINLSPGCGALNLVNVAEPLKIARMLAGIDNSDASCTHIIPKLPDSWKTFEAKDWAVNNGSGTSLCDISFVGCKNKRLTVKVTSGAPLARLSFTLNGVRRTFENVTELAAE